MKRFLLCLAFALILGSTIVRAHEFAPVFALTESWIGAVAWSPEESVLTVVTQHGVLHYAANTWTLLDDMPLPFSVPLSPPDPSYVTMSADASTLFWHEPTANTIYAADLASGQITQVDVIDNPEMRVLSLRASADGTVLAYTVRLFDPQEGGGASAYRSYYGWDYDRPFVRAVVYDFRAGVALRSVEYYHGSISMLLSPDGRWFVIAHGSNPNTAETILYDLAGDRETRLTRHNLALQDFSDDSAHFIGTISEDLYLWNATAGFSPDLPVPAPSHWLGMSFGRVVFAPFARTAAIADNCDRLSIRDFEEGGSLLLTDALGGCQDDLVFSPDGRFLAVSGRDGVLNVWDVSP